MSQPTLNTLVQQISVMLGMQAALNAKVFPDWADRGLAWHRAIYAEAVELMDHMGSWKWWKKGDPDFAQANMELIDIWHFGLSWHLQHSKAAPEELARHLAEAVLEVLTRSDASRDPLEVPPEERHRCIDRLIAEAAGAQVFSIEPFCQLLCLNGLTFDDVYRQYVGKNVLNGFRQQHGYKTGTYEKEWEGREDNEHLTEILQSLPLDAALPLRVYDELLARYPG